MLRTIAVSALAACLLSCPSLARAERCTDAALHRILAPRPTTGATHAVVDCDLELSPLFSAAIGRDLHFVGAASSGVVVDCGGGTIGRPEAPVAILVQSRRLGDSELPGLGVWEPVTDVTIRDCEIHGSVRVRGIGSGGPDDEVTRSSHLPFGQVERVRAGAPRRILLENVTIVGAGRIPLYVSPGVEDVTLLRSYLTGVSQSTAIYLDAESRGTTIRDTTIDTRTRRELIAVDGSEDNRIIGNRFEQLAHGGIYLYRNCGERSFVRRTTPQRNQILNNVFVYRAGEGLNPGVYFGADGGHATHRFCDQDLAYPWGSGADDRDFAAHNAVMQNQFVGQSPGVVIHTEWPATNTPNHVEHNTRVDAPVSRPSGCVVGPWRAPRFLAHGASTVLDADRHRHPYEAPVEVTCSDGELAYASAPQLRAVHEVAFGCAASGDNTGCRGELRCPGGGALVGARAACNLEFGAVTDAQLAEVPASTLRVVRISDVPLAGRCWIDGEVLPGGEIPLLGRLDPEAATFGCREHDRNGGDCEIRGVAQCVSR